MYFPFCFGLLLMLKWVNDVACLLLEMLQYTVFKLKFANLCKQYIKMSTCTEWCNAVVGCYSVEAHQMVSFIRLSKNM